MPVVVDLPGVLESGNTWATKNNSNISNLATFSNGLETSIGTLATTVAGKASTASVTTATTTANSALTTANSALTAANSAAADPRFVAPTGDRQTGSITLAATHAGAVIEVDSVAAATVTVPPLTSVAWIDNTIVKIRQAGAGQVTVAPGSGVTLRIADGGLKTASQWKSVLLSKRAGGQVSAPPTSQLLARWRADDLTGANNSAVASWPETSGNGLPAAVQATTANQPLLKTGASGINGRKTINFDSVNDYLTLSGSALALAQNRTALTVVVVYRYATAQSGARCFLSLSASSAATARRLNVNQRATSGNFMAGTHIHDTDTSAFIAATTGSTTGAAGVLTTRFDYTGGKISFYKDGTPVGTNLAFQAASAGPTDNTASAGGFIGSTLGTGDYLGGEIAEILIYNSIDTNLLPAIDTYVQNFYAITMADASPIGDEWVVEGGVA